MSDPHDLQRFVDAQAPVMAQVDAELSAGAKTGHWMWFVFPQLKGLGRSATAERYGIASQQEAAAYWAHPVLGPRLKRCVQRLLAVPGKSAQQIFGSPDDLKFCSCLTLFETVAPGEPVWALALDRWYGGQRDPRTLELLNE
ncbi:DUF1810 domain-containing protein [Rhizobacter sp. J219]|jgi:uncharacterized protein (DUF1810 family)|uniref:DUF1810 domain-containing protein n=1 Tax=Rhizobacter sp. J219 TaxID=2898430 RepID=UPI002150C21F|nr:DUF1810 domain-containing protein [Rhizobacter sp. J219]MCR5885089.1 DUF1810 domain-containing protein [Rhizobacter sp. J219]